MTNRMKELEMKEKSSKSLLANVLDMDDDFRYVMCEYGMRWMTKGLKKKVLTLRDDMEKAWVDSSQGSSSNQTQ